MSKLGFHGFRTSRICSFKKYRSFKRISGIQAFEAFAILCVNIRKFLQFSNTANTSHRDMNVKLLYAFGNKTRSVKSIWSNLSLEVETEIFRFGVPRLRIFII